MDTLQYLLDIIRENDDFDREDIIEILEKTILIMEK